MILRNIFISQSSGNPVTDTEAQNHLRDLDPGNLSQIQMYLKAAVQSIQAELISLQLMQATYELQMDDWLTDPVTSGTPYPFAQVSVGGSSNYITLPKCPLVSITSVKYDDLTNTEQTLAASNYFIDSSSMPGRLQWASNASLPSTFNKPNCIRIRYVAGFGATGDVDATVQGLIPFPIKAAILMRTGQLYETRQEEIVGQRLDKFSIAVDRLISPYRIPS